MTQGFQKCSYLFIAPILVHKTCFAVTRAESHLRINKKILMIRCLKNFNEQIDKLNEYFVYILFVYSVTPEFEFGRGHL